MARRLTGTQGGEGQGRVPTLVAQIVEELSQDILEGRFTPGERIREQDLADRFQTSRAPVREAIRLLEIDGLIETQHWRGASVVELSVDEIDDLFEMLSALFGLVSKLAARHGSRSDMRLFEAAVDRMRSARTENVSPVERVKIAFDAAGVLRRMCGSTRVSEMLLRTSRIAFLNHKVALSADEAWQQEALTDWRRLGVAISDRDDEGAEAIARGIVRRTQTFTMSKLRGEEAAVASPALPRARLRRRTPEPAA